MKNVFAFEEARVAGDSAGHEVLNDVILNQALVSFGEKTARVIDVIQAEGTCWCCGKFSYRFAAG